MKKSALTENTGFRNKRKAGEWVVKKLGAGEEEGITKDIDLSKGVTHEETKKCLRDLNTCSCELASILTKYRTDFINHFKALKWFSNYNKSESTYFVNHDEYCV